MSFKSNGCDSFSGAAAVPLITDRIQGEVKKF